MVQIPDFEKAAQAAIAPMEPEKVVSKEKGAIESKKWLATMSTILFVILTDALGVNLKKETFDVISSALQIYVLGQGTLDLVKLAPHVIDAMKQVRQPKVTQ